MNVENEVTELKAAIAAIEAHFGRKFMPAPMEPSKGAPFLGAQTGEPNPMDPGPQPKFVPPGQPFPPAQTGEPNPMQG